MIIKNIISTTLITLVIPLSACAQKYTHDENSNTAPTENIFFTVEKGQLQAIGPDGLRINLEPVTFPVDSKQILSIDQITIIKVKGSHFTIGCSGGRCGRINLPAPHP